MGALALDVPGSDCPKMMYLPIIAESHQHPSTKPDLYCMYEYNKAVLVGTMSIRSCESFPSLEIAEWNRRCRARSGMGDVVLERAKIEAGPIAPFTILHTMIILYSCQIQLKHCH